MWILKFFEQSNSENNRVISEAPLISENSTHYPQSQNERKDSEAERDRQTDKDTKSFSPLASSLEIDSS